MSAVGSVGKRPSRGAGGPLVSIVIRSVGRPELARALDSVGRQSYRPIEVVCVNAIGPGHPEVQAPARDVTVRVVGEGTALGRSRAANVGLSAALGEYVGFLDDDDWFMEDHVATLVEALAANPGRRVAYADVDGVAPDGSVVHRFAEPFGYPRLCIGNFIPSNAALFERALLAEGCAVDESLEVYEDWDFWLQLAARSEFVHVPRVTAACSMGGSSGVGLRPDPERQRAARARIYEKWRRHWSGEQIDAVIEKLLGDVQARERLMLETLAAADKLAEEARTAAADAEQARAELRLLMASRSWRWTAPLRRLWSLLSR